eukprot:Clim_evm92s243 gene=Clim_evmTU92s243
MTGLDARQLTPEGLRQAAFKLEEEARLFRAQALELEKRQTTASDKINANPWREHVRHRLTTHDVARYSRQLILPEIGPFGQEKLLNSAVLIVGAGGLGCPSALTLAAAGVGCLGFVDGDEVSENNLHRQFAHSEPNIGKNKAESLCEICLRINGRLRAVPYSRMLTRVNAMEIVKDWDVVLDCSDNAPTRYLVNDVCVLLGKPLISGSALRWEGQISAYHTPMSNETDATRSACYRCVFPEPPPAGTVTNCAESGVLGPVVGVIGNLQAQEAIRLIVTGTSKFTNALGLWDGKACRLRSVKIRTKRTDCAICSAVARATIKNVCDEAYDVLGLEQPAHDKISCDSISLLKANDRVDATVLKDMLDRDEVLVIDVRPQHEYDIMRLHSNSSVILNYPLGRLRQRDEREKLREHLQRDVKANIVFVCRMGNDSQRALQMLHEDSSMSEVLGTKTVKDLKGGYFSWKAKVEPTLPMY